MKWTIHELREQAGDILQFQNLLELEDDLKLREPSIISVDPVKVKGYIDYSPEEIILHGEIKLDMVLPSTRTLEPVNCQLQVPILERYVYPNQEGNLEDYAETTIVLDKDYIDLNETVIDLVITNIPSKVYNTTEEEANFPKGKDWQVYTEETFIQEKKQAKSETGDPRFAALKDLLNKEED